ncbi:methyltransferase [Zavarzinia sp. CC-PAN008]|uniref:methyltransferase n=1 Tax=Zavarzinia sp. CC-PAN008 TaxID=3243332 RepID=UPI003F746CE3
MGTGPLVRPLPARATATPARHLARWHEAWLRLRNGLLASPRFQRAALRLPFARPIARRNARALFDLVAGFVYSQVLAACIQVRLFDHLAAGPGDAAGLAPHLGLSPAATERLLKAAASLGLAQGLAGGRFALGPLGAALLGNPGIAPMVAHHAMLYADLAEPLAVLERRSPARQLGGFWPYSGNADPTALPPERARAYSELMAASQAMIADQVLDAWPVHRHRRLLDVGGGAGAFLAAAGARAPRLELVLFDLPPVVSLARQRLEAAGLAARSTCVGGSFFTDPLPTGADIASLVRVLHDHDDSAALAILRNVHAALAPGATLLVAEPMAGTAGAGPMGDAYFGLYLAAMGSGRPRTQAELTAMLVQAGFGAVRHPATAVPLMVQVLVAQA